MSYIGSLVTLCTSPFSIAFKIQKKNQNKMESGKHPVQCRHCRTRVATVIMRMHDVKVTVALTTYRNAHAHGSYNLGLEYGPPG